MFLSGKIRDIPDFPRPGIIFRDITTLIADADAFKYSVNKLVKHFRDKQVTKIVAIESRGFIFGGVAATKLGVGLVPVRKKGKLPYSTVAEEYELEYGAATIEIHTDALDVDDRVLIIDDLLATGGTARATVNLVEKLGAEVVGLGFVIELSFLNGRDKLKGYDVLTLVDYESELDEERPPASLGIEPEATDSD